MTVLASKWSSKENSIHKFFNLDFSDSVVESLGKAFGTYLVNNNSRKISISGDIRKTTGHLKELLIKGVSSVGVDVYDMGILPTPLNYFSLYHTDIQNSIQVTGSHNPKEYNGFKISYNNFDVVDFPLVPVIVIFFILG